VHPVVAVRPGDDDDDVGATHERNEPGLAVASGVAVVDTDLDSELGGEGQDLALDPIVTPDERDAGPAHVGPWNHSCPAVGRKKPAGTVVSEN
jgi:hypothetical protein